MEYILSEFDREHIEGWKRMKEEIKRLNWNEVPLVTVDDFTSSLIFLPPAKPENSKKGMLIICAGGGFTFKSVSYTHLNENVKYVSTEIDIS